MSLSPVEERVLTLLERVRSRDPERGWRTAFEISDILRMPYEDVVRALERLEELN